MKKILFVATLFLCTVAAKAQTATLMPLVAGDTVVNTATVAKSLPQFTGGYSGVTITPVLNKVSGTVAGKIYLYESLDGSNYGYPVDSLVNADQSINTKSFHRAAPICNFYKVTCVGAGTMSAQLRIYYAQKIYGTKY